MTEQALDATPRSSTTPTTTRARWRRAPGQLNPYKLGIELFRDIEDRWNKGQFGKEYDECDDLRRSARLGQASSGLGRRRSSRCAALQRRHVHRRVPHAEFCQRAEVVHASASTSAAATARSTTREFKKVKEQAAVPADQLRPAVHLRRGRQLREPRRAAAAPPARGHRPQTDYARDTLEALARICSTGTRRSSTGEHLEDPLRRRVVGEEHCPDAAIQIGPR